ncbi:precorrin-8X methylmutase [Desulfovermiculus halophilus]|uniref:precorrin-8X methylmutase n=1 Tax=Desulfovermiculus halophilus TaxID=339722 RepID=UPI0004802FE6|nr:precorrin-8X methylmutase [Desulfovermiculus halophilus]
MPNSQTISPQDIESRSMAIIDREVPEPRPFSSRQWPVVRRMIHASADFELLSLVCFHPQAIQAGITALSQGCKVVTDTRMARAGITQARMQRLGCRVECLLDQPGVDEKAAQRGMTRSAAGMEQAVVSDTKTIFVIGNAPTALFSLIQAMQDGVGKAELIVGMPVGFVGAAESKEALVQISNVPWITITGRKGGSPLAAACVNALAEMALTI